MKIRHEDLVIDQERPFVNCKLERERFATILTDIVETYSDGFVLAINNEWGTGKTTFVKMWQQHLINNEFRTIYFNAWENDFDTNPLVSIVSELNSLTNKTNSKAFKSIIEKGAVLTRNIVPGLVKGVLTKYGADEILTTAIEDSAKGATEILEAELKNYSKKKETIGEFRKELENFVNKENNNKPLVFIIDELDRCRPTYAVEVLEQMKHFFSVTGIIFVLSIDKKHLSSSIKGFYGSDQINSDEYLRRFIDLEYSIPNPSISVFCRYLFDYFSFDTFLSTDNRKKYKLLKNDDELFLKMAEILFNRSGYNLRQQEKIFAQTRLVLHSFNVNQFAFPHLLLALIFIKTTNKELYNQIEKRQLTVQQLSDSFSSIISTEMEEIRGINLLYVEALLLHFYNNSLDHNVRTALFEVDKEGSVRSIINSKLERKITLSTLAGCLKDLSDHWDYREIKISFLLNRINLTEPLAIQ